MIEVFNVPCADRDSHLMKMCGQLRFPSLVKATASSLLDSAKDDVAIEWARLQPSPLVRGSQIEPPDTLQAQFHL